MFMRWNARLRFEFVRHGVCHMWCDIDGDGWYSAQKWYLLCGIWNGEKWLETKKVISFEAVWREKHTWHTLHISHWYLDFVFWFIFDSNPMFLITPHCHCRWSVWQSVRMDITWFQGQLTRPFECGTLQRAVASEWWRDTPTGWDRVYVFVNGGCYFVDWFGWGALDSVLCKYSCHEWYA